MKILTTLIIEMDAPDGVIEEVRKNNLGLEFCEMIKDDMVQLILAGIETKQNLKVKGKAQIIE